jgi:hypothetical protein
MAGTKGSGITRLVKANQTLAVGISEAVSQGYGAFASALKGDFNKPGFDNPLLKGALDGWISGLDRATAAWLEASREFLK